LLACLAACVETVDVEVDAGDAQLNAGDARLDARAAEFDVGDAQFDTGDTRVDGDDAGDAQVDAREANAALASERLGVLDASLAQWERLTADAGARYWYEEENCSGNTLFGELALIQVETDGAHLVARASIPFAECQEHVNRFRQFRPVTIPALYRECAELVTSRSPPEVFALDDAGLLRSCYLSHEPDCFDACGNGFHLRAFGFGSVPANAYDAGVDVSD
jgi:hypothetical protein